LAWVLVQAPGASSSRPPVSSSRAAAVWAMTSGVRSRVIWVQPMVRRSVASPMAVSEVTESRISSIVSEKKPIS
jgi:hypothetical protein